MICLVKTQDDWVKYLVKVAGEIKLVMNEMNIESKKLMKYNVRRRKDNM